MKHMRGLLLTAAVMMTMAAQAAHATPVTLPSSLSPGDQYRLAFVTSGINNATSTAISTYDTFVSTQANSNASLLALGTTWLAIGSTATVDAHTHIGGNFTIPVYNLAGSLVAIDAADLWDGSLAALIDLDQNGAVRNTVVWTGTNSNGSTSTNPLGASIPTFGNSSFSSSAWIFDGQLGSPTTFSFYGISDVLTVPGAAVPEPGTLALMGLALAAIGGLRRHRSRPN